LIPKGVYEYAGINRKGEDISDQRPASEETLKSESAFDVSSSMIKSGRLSDEDLKKLNKARMDVIDANTSGSDKKIRKATERLEELTRQLGKVQTMTNESGKALYETSSELNDMNSNRAIGESVLNAVQSSTSNVNNNVSNVTVNQTGQLDPTTSLMFGANGFGGYGLI
jgi:septal ring factor EnvC (AmiA/AmiB activator)